MSSNRRHVTLPTKVFDSEGRELIFAYDEIGQFSGVIAEDGVGGAVAVSFNYNEDEKITGVEVESDTATPLITHGLTCHPDGNPATYTDPEGHVLQFAEDELD